MFKKKTEKLWVYCAAASIQVMGSQSVVMLKTEVLKTTKVTIWWLVKAMLSTFKFGPSGFVFFHWKKTWTGGYMFRAA